MVKRTLPVRNRNVKMDEHHLEPRFHGGTKKNGILKIPITMHRAFHTLFGFKKPEQAMAYLAAHFFPENGISFVTIRNGNVEIRLRKKDLERLRLEERMPKFEDVGKSPYVRKIYCRKRRLRQVA